MKAYGYAIIEGGEIDVRTVSPTRRAAIVNWLVIHRSKMIYAAATDEEIEKLWELYGGAVTLREVEIIRRK